VKRFWLLQFVCNALLLFAFYEWLGVRDSRASQLILSFVLGAAIIAGTVFLHSRTFHMKPLQFAAALLIFALVGWGLLSLPIDQAGLWLASTLTYRIRKPFNPATVTQALGWLRWFVQWIVVPLVLLRQRNPRFWWRFAATVVLAFLVPSYLVHWTPKLTATSAQVVSFVLRFGVAYLLITTGFVAIWRITSSGSPVESQPSTAALP
jgi:hypothetical protein